MTEDPVEGIKLYWAENKLCFSNFSKEEARTLLKVMILKNTALMWGDGFVHLARIELLVKAFPEDGLLKEIYQQLLERCNTWMTEILNEENFGNTMEHCFSDQPTTYDHHGNGTRTWYDVNNDDMMRKLINKHPKLEGAIKGVVYI